jgi:hypothetical protein
VEAIPVAAYGAWGAWAERRAQLEVRAGEDDAANECPDLAPFSIGIPQRKKAGDEVDQ